MRSYAVLLLLAIVPACSGADGADAAHAADAAATTAPQPAPVAPVMRASFEDASAVCNDWAADGADAIRSVPPRSGDYACRICATGALPDIAIGHAAGALDPGRYVLTAWLRARPNRASPAGASAVLEADTAGGMVRATSPVAIGDDYARVEVTLDLTQHATAIRARIGAVASADECVLIDDVLVERLR